MLVGCPVCGGTLRSCFQAMVLHKYTAQYEVCNACGYLRAHEPHWLEEAYSSAIAAADTGLVARNVSLAIKVASLLYWVMGERGQGRYLDAAGGYGMLTRLMRDLGVDFYWADKYCDNLLARGFEYSDRQKGCRAVTAMEVIEHVTDPLAFVDDVLRSANAETLIFTTELYQGEPPGQDWWYYAFPTGQHISFFTQASIEKIGERLGLRFFSANGLHVLTRQSISEQRFRWATHPWVSKVSLLWIRRHLSSKTMDDHLKMMGSL